MATLLDLFKSQKKDLYGKSENIRIESRGLINPPRGAALLASSPNALADLIGNQIGGALKGSANRPSDTIFRNNTPFAKPISLFKSQDGLRNAVDKNTKYYIKDNPAPTSLIASFKQGASTVGGMAANLAIKGITKGGLKDLANNLKNKENAEVFGTQYGRASVDGKTTNLLKEDKKFTSHYKNKDGKLTVRNSTGAGTPWDEGQKKLLEAISITDTELTNGQYANHVVVTFETIPTLGSTSLRVPFVGSITGISEDVTPTWSNFKYLGSPFSIYRYGGVERTLRFNLKLYYTTIKERDAMITKINYLKSLAFPDTNLKAIAFGGVNSAYAIAPNLIKVTIGDLYKQLPGFIESLSFEIDDNTIWANSSKIDDTTDSTFLYPSVVDVSIGIKIIENHNIESSGEKGDTKTYRYNFDGRATTELK